MVYSEWSFSKEQILKYVSYQFCASFNLISIVTTVQIICSQQWVVFMLNLCFPT